MKKILILIVIFMSFSLFSYAENINECKTDIYYGNGVWNEYEDADDSRSELESLIKDEVIDGDMLLQAKYGKTKLSYNTSFGKLGDVLEVYYQLKEARQLDGVGFYTAIAALTVYQPDITLGAIATQKLTESLIKTEEEANVGVMWEKYYQESFKLGHRVLLVSHSQGNLFANRIYDTINPTEYRTYFANLQVASPASEVKATEVGKGSYVTLFGDLIINPIPNSMSPNANGDLEQLKSAGHAFVSAYLGQKDPYNKIVSRIKAVLPTLDVELTQWNTDQEFDKNTCNEKVTVKHRFDLAVDMPYKVYPFNLSKKLYQVNEEWVKASCGGNNILDQWDGKKENECWMIDNVEKEKIGMEVAKIIYRTAGALYISGSASPQYSTFYLDGENLFDMYFPPYRYYGSTVQGTCSDYLSVAKDMYAKAEQYAVNTFNQNLQTLKQQFPGSRIEFEVFKELDYCTNCTLDSTQACAGYVSAGANVWNR